MERYFAYKIFTLFIQKDVRTHTNSETPYLFLEKRVIVIFFPPLNAKETYFFCINTPVQVFTLGTHRVCFYFFLQFITFVRFKRECVCVFVSPLEQQFGVFHVRISVCCLTRTGTGHNAGLSFNFSCIERSWQCRWDCSILKSCLAAYRPNPCRTRAQIFSARTSVA